MTLTQRTATSEEAVTLPPLLLRPVNLDAAAESALNLLSGHGTAPPPLAADTTKARLFTLSDLASDTDELFAAARTIDVGPDTVELESLAVQPGLPMTAVASRLIAALADWLRSAGWRRLIVIDTDVDAGWTAVLSTAGFRPPEASAPGGDRRLELVL